MKIVNGFQPLNIFAKAPSQMFDWVLNTHLVMILCEAIKNGTLSLTGSK